MFLFCFFFVCFFFFIGDLESRATSVRVSFPGWRTRRVRIKRGDRVAGTSRENRFVKIICVILHNLNYDWSMSSCLMHFSWFVVAVLFSFLPPFIRPATDTNARNVLPNIDPLLYSLVFFIAHHLPVCQCAVHKRCHEKILGKCPGSGKESQSTIVSYLSSFQIIDKYIAAILRKQ